MLVGAVCVTIAPTVDVDFEAKLRDPEMARVVSAWASIWLDLLTVSQTIYARLDIPMGDYAQVFKR